MCGSNSSPSWTGKQKIPDLFVLEGYRLSKFEYLVVLRSDCT